MGSTRFSRLKKEEQELVVIEEHALRNRLAENQHGFYRAPKGQLYLDGVIYYKEVPYISFPGAKDNKLGRPFDRTYAVEVDHQLSTTRSGHQCVIFNVETVHPLDFSENISSIQKEAKVFYKIKSCGTDKMKYYEEAIKNERQDISNNVEVASETPGNLVFAGGQGF